MKPRNQNNAKGMDVSHHQGLIDWMKVKASGVIDFAFVKATEGIGYIDEMFRRNAAGANAVGIPVGYYHYAHPENNSAKDEAGAFLAAIKGQAYQLPFVLDLEGEASKLDTAKLSKWAVDFINYVYVNTGKPVMLYTGAYFARDELNKSLGFAPLWIAHYGAQTPLVNGTWNDWTFFQYSSTGSVVGVKGNVDMNEYNGSVEDMLGIKPMSAADANKIIAFLKAGYDFVNDPEAHIEFNRVANELRRVSGQPMQ